MRSSVCAAVDGCLEDALSQEFYNFMSIVMQLTLKDFLRDDSKSRCCSGEGHTHMQSRTTFWDSNGGEKNSRSGLCFRESCRFCFDVWICKFQTTKDGANVYVVSTGGFRDTAGSS